MDFAARITIFVPLAFLTALFAGAIVRKGCRRVRGVADEQGEG